MVHCISVLSVQRSERKKSLSFTFETLGKIKLDQSLLGYLQDYFAQKSKQLKIRHKQTANKC